MEKPRYIDATALAERVRSGIQMNHNADPVLKLQQIQDYKAFLNMIQETPTEDVEPVVHSAWVPDHKDIDCCYCQKCGSMPRAYESDMFGIWTEETDRCPKCGALMDLEVTHASEG